MLKKWQASCQIKLLAVVKSAKRSLASKMKILDIYESEQIIAKTSEAKTDKLSPCDLAARSTS